LDDTNREEQHVSPLIRIAAIRSGENDIHEIYASFSRASQVPSYTALSSNPSAGLFRGNAGLADEVTRTSEVGWDIRSELWTIHSAIFLRSTKDLTDWIYDPTIRPFAARSAANVDLDTWGSEFVAIYDSAIARLGGSYTYLNKDIESAQAPQRGSFYALNFPTHRVTAVVSFALADDIELSSAVEFRNQFENELRSSQDKTYVLQRAAISYQVSEQVKLSLAGDNLWKENFEDVPESAELVEQRCCGLACRLLRRAKLALNRSLLCASFLRIKMALSALSLRIKIASKKLIARLGVS
jgi:outer membrane receptor for monomeric catechols